MAAKSPKDPGWNDPDYMKDQMAFSLCRPCGLNLYSPYTVYLPLLAIHPTRTLLCTYSTSVLFWIFVVLGTGFMSAQFGHDSH
jgi:hypothetical protein